MADMLTSLVDKTSNMILFPHVASMQTTALDVRARLLRARRTMILLVAVGLAAFISISDVAIRLLYDYSATKPRRKSCPCCCSESGWRFSAG